MNVKPLLSFGGILVVGLAVGVLADDKPGQKNATPPKRARPAPALANLAAVPNFPVIMYLERRGQTITVKAGPKGPVYSVRTPEGKTLFENVSAEQLRAQAPELHEFIKTAVAGGCGKTGVVIDASVRLR
jgi:hypothetical protein